MYKNLDLQRLIEFLLPILLILLTTATGTGEEYLIMRWEYVLPGEVSALTVGDIDGDGHNEIIAASSNDLYIFSKEGSIETKYNLDSNGTIYVLYPADLDNDGRDEILIGTGWMEEKRITGGYFALTDSMLEEKNKVLYKTIRNKGGIYILDESLSKWINISGWVRSIHVADLNSSGSKEVIVASGGINIDFFELIFRTEGNITRNRTEESVRNGSISIFNKDRELLFNYQMNAIPWSVYSYDLYGDGFREILSCFMNKLYVFDNELRMLWTHEAPDTVKQIYSGDILGSDIRSIILSFDGITVDGIQLVSNNGNEIWTYRLPPRNNIVTILVTDIDLDGDKEIVIAFNNKIHILSKDSKLEWKYMFKDKINKLCLTNSDLIIASESKISVYKVSAEFIKKQNADYYLLESRRYYDAGNYEDAEKYIEMATELYQSINYSKGISDCNSLMVMIRDGLKRNKEIMAHSLYSKALSYYALGHYEEAMRYAENSSRIYMEINDRAGIEKCDALIRKISEMSIVVTTTTTSIATTSLFTPPHIPQRKKLSDKGFILLMSGLLILFILSIKMRKMVKVKEKNSDLKELKNNL